MKAFLTANYGLIPYTNQWMVISGSEQLKIFWSFDSGVEYINKLGGNKEKKSRKKVNKQILDPVLAMDSPATDHQKTPSKKGRLK
jgi:hypothetical protein